MNEENFSKDSTRPPHLIDKLKEQDRHIKKGWNWKEIFKELLSLVIIVFGIVVPFRVYVAEPYLVDGASMDPTFKTGDYLIVDKISEKSKRPERNSVIVFKYPNNPDKNFIKRIIGLPGETVVVKDGTVKIINTENPQGFLLDQSYVTHKSSYAAEKKLGETEYFVMGDNRTDSFDSRYWGALDEKFILGKPVIQLFPVSQIGIYPGKI